MRGWKTALLALLLLLLAGCGAEVPAVEATETTEAVERLERVVTEENIGELEDYPGLKYLDLSGSTCYDAIARYRAAHPEVEVRYTLTFGSRDVPDDAAELTLAPEDQDYAQLMERLQYLENLQTLTLQEPTFTPEQLAQLRDTYENTAIRCKFTLLGQQIAEDTQKLDLSGIQPEDVEGVAKVLPMLAALETVELMDGEDACALSLDCLLYTSDAADE